jgi:peptidyl-prolyl cis-trans isomerase A (cyclophilin A)
MTRVQIQTRLGKIVLETSPQAPITSANFLRYVNENRYSSASFYRTVRLDNQAQSPVKIEVIQGGIGMDDHPAKLPNILLETTAQTGLKHLNGTVSMSRFSPDSAHSEIFICIGAQPELDFGGQRHPDGQGFAAFAQVIEGMDVVLEIQAQASGGDAPPVQGQWLLDPVLIESVSCL